MQTSKEVLRIMTFSAYDLQKLRIQTGLRLCANFRSRLKLIIKGTDEPDPEIPEDEEDEEKKEAMEIIKHLKEAYTRLTDGIVKRHRTLPEEKAFKGDPLITSFAELVLIHNYIQLEKDERQQFSTFESALNAIPIYTDYLKGVVGIGPAMSAVMISYFDIEEAKYASQFWKYAGLDVAEDGMGRSRRAEHLIDREYKKRDGTIGVRKSVTFEPWLKARLLGVMGVSLLRAKGSTWKLVYDQYKHRLVTDPNRRKVTLAEYKRAHAADEDTTQMWPPLRIHRASVRYMVKMFLLEFHTRWRSIEGLEVHPSYHEGKLGHKHRAA